MSALPLRNTIPPSEIHWTAASINGAAVPYGSRSTTSTRLRSSRWLYISELATKTQSQWQKPYGKSTNGYYHASPSLTSTSGSETSEVVSEDTFWGEVAGDVRPLIATLRLIASTAPGDKSFAITRLIAWLRQKKSSRWQWNLTWSTEFLWHSGLNGVQLRIAPPEEWTCLVYTANGEDMQIK